jgi:hypothetical protein
MSGAIAALIVVTGWKGYSILGKYNLFTSDQVSVTSSGVEKAFKSPNLAFQDLLEASRSSCKEAFQQLNSEFKAPFTLEHELFQLSDHQESRLLLFVDRLSTEVLNRQISTIIFDNLELEVFRNELSPLEFNKKVQELNICRDSAAIEILETLFRASKMNNYSLKFKRILGKKLLQSLIQEGGGGFYTFENLSFRLALLKKMITYDFLPNEYNEQIIELDERIFDANNSQKKLKELLGMNKSFSAELFDLSSEIYRINQIVLQ